MAQQLGLLIKGTGWRGVGGGEGDDPMCDDSASSTGGMEVICVRELQPWLLAAQVRALVIEGLGVDPMELGSRGARRDWTLFAGTGPFTPTPPPLPPPS